MNNPPRYAFDCSECGKFLKLAEEVYKTYYDGHELCMSCRPGELPQERLSEDEVNVIAKLYEGETKWAADPADVKSLLAEVKRLKAIEAERNRYKSLVDSIDKQIACGDPYQHAAKIGRWIKQFYEGAEPNESN